MGKSTKTYEERIQEKDLRIEKLAQELKRYEAQKKQLEKRKKEGNQILISKEQYEGLKKIVSEKIDLGEGGLR